MSHPYASFELLPPAAPVAEHTAFRLAEIPTRAFEPLLLGNGAWYCQLRWVVVACLTLFGAVSFLPDLFPDIGLKSNLTWPILLAGALCLANAVFLLHIRHLRRSGTLKGLRGNLWCQILFDLAVVTVLIHQIGSVETYVVFLFLFHIVLSCIFLPRLESLAVTLISFLFYWFCVFLEIRNILPASTLFLDAGPRAAILMLPGFPLPQLGSVGFILTVVWFLTSQISAMLRRREKDLMETNDRLLHSQKERMHFMLQTTHELKAPFAAIQANTQLLLKGYCGALTPDALEIIQRINDRSHRLAGMIQEMLQLANLRSQSEGPLRMTNIDLAAALVTGIEQVRQIAEEHHVSLREEIGPALTFGVEEHMKMLFINLLKNAIQYSRSGGSVLILCKTIPGGQGPEVIIEDKGIGIPADKLPRIFDEYYRTNEAIQHNKDSTGLGLSIVRHIAETHRIRIRVESAIDEGTAFSLRFQRETPAVPATVPVAGNSPVRAPAQKGDS